MNNNHNKLENMDVEANQHLPASAALKAGKESPSSKNPSSKRVKAVIRLKRILRFKWLKAIQLLLAVYIALMVFTPTGTFGNVGGLRDSETGFIIDQNSPIRTEEGIILINGDERAIVAKNTFQLVALGLSRISAFFEYPALVFAFLTKLRVTMTFLSYTPFSMFMFEDLHDLHVYCGWSILFSSVLHTVMHLLRWADQGNLALVVKNSSGLSGIFILTTCLLICLPMMVLKKLKYEIRKYCHYLFYVFGLALCFHAPASAVPNGGFAPYVFSILLAWTVLDSLYVQFFMTEKIETTVFHVLPSGIQLTMDVSSRFQNAGQQGGYCYVCFPWIDKHQWHAFSLFEKPSNPRQRQIFIATNGDWTKAVHESLQRNTNRPVWVQGPFPSPYNNSIEYDNQVLVASGIGITPALSVIRRAQQEGARRANLVWMVRDLQMLEFFLKHAYLESNNGWNLIYYTGKQPLVTDTFESSIASNVRIIHGRPDLDNIVPAIIQGIESGHGLPERLGRSNKQEAVFKIAEELMRVEKQGGLSDQEKISHLSSYAHDLGYLFTDIVSALDVSVVDEVSPGGEDEESRETESDHSESTLATYHSQPFMLRRMYSSQSILRQLSARALRPSPRKGAKTESSTLNQGRRGEATSNVGFKPWERHDSAKDFVKAMKTEELATWGILYCGGSKKIEKKLEHSAEELGLDFHAESFSW